MSNFQKTAMPVTSQKIEVHPLYLLVAFPKHTADTSGSDKDVIRCVEQLVKGNAGSIVEMVVLPTKTVRHETVQFQKTAVVFGEKNAVIVVSDFFCKRCGEIALNGVDILHPGCFNRTFLVPPLKNRTVFGKAHRIHAAFFGFYDVLSVFCDRINIGNAI